MMNFLPPFMMFAMAALSFKNANNWASGFNAGGGVALLLFAIKDILEAAQ